MLGILDKPEYFFSPQQIARRFAFRPREEQVDVRLPWGLVIRVHPGETIGRSCCTLGLYDLPVTEAIFRLLDEGETAVDAGANIGHMTAAMVRRTGPSGRIFCFEPSEQIFAELESNIARWAPYASIQAEQCALSSVSGDGELRIPESFRSNRGVATLERGMASVATERVALRRLDDYMAAATRIGVMKVDVEGHELELLRGCSEMLGQRIRDIIFEEQRPYPSEVHVYLEERGYKVFRLDRGFWRPLLRPPESRPRRPYLPSNFLATTAEDRARERFRAFGWQALRRAPAFTNRSPA